MNIRGVVHVLSCPVVTEQAISFTCRVLHTHTHSLTLTRTHTRTHTHTHTHTHCLSLTHPHTHRLSCLWLLALQTLQSQDSCIVFSCTSAYMGVHFREVLL